MAGAFFMFFSLTPKSDPLLQTSPLPASILATPVAGALPLHLNVFYGVIACNPIGCKQIPGNNKSFLVVQKGCNYAIE
jgi:hypothetical protein